MQIFQDRNGNDWEISLTYATAEKIKAKFGVDLLEPIADAEAINDLFSSIRKQGDLLWFLCSAKAKERGIVDVPDGPDAAELFHDLFEPPQMKASFAALRAELHFFIQSLNPEAAAGLEKVLGMAKKVMETNLDQIDKMMSDERITSKVKENTEKALEKALAKMEKDLDAAISATGNTSGTPAG